MACDSGVQTFNLRSLGARVGFGIWDLDLDLAGYAYCHNCTDYQAMMPRSASGSGGGASTTGYDAVPVCAFCIELLTSEYNRFSFIRYPLPLPISESTVDRHGVGRMQYIVLYT